MWFFLLLFSSCMCAMQSDKNRAVSHRVHVPYAAAANSDSSLSSSPLHASNSTDTEFASPEEKDELFSRALGIIYPVSYEIVNEHIKLSLERVIQQPIQDIDDEMDESNVNVLRRLRSGDIDDRHAQYIKRLVMKATSDAFDLQQQQINQHKKNIETLQSVLGEKDEEIDQRLSRSSTAVIALLSSMISSACGVIIAIYSK